MSRDESAGAQRQCARCDQARSCWILDTLEGHDGLRGAPKHIEVVDLNLIGERYIRIFTYCGGYRVTMSCLFIDLPKEGT